MTRCLPVATLALSVCFLAPQTSFAQSAKTADLKKDDASKDSKTADKDVKAPDKETKLSDYDKAVKDLTKIPGSFTLYLRNKREVLLEVPEDKLGKVFLIQAAFNTGLDSAFLHAGMPIGGNDVDAFKWQKNDDQLWLVRPHIAYRWDANDDFAVGAQRSFPEAILGSYRIEQTDTDKHLYLINITRMFYGELFHLPEMVAGGLGGPYGLDMEKSIPDSVKGYPDTSVVRMNLHFFSPRGAQGSMLAMLLGLSGNTLEDDRSAPVKVTYTMWYRNDDGYTPRLADPRVGYFTTDFFSLDHYLNKDRTERYINRFHVEKKDPKAKISEPIKPIVWTIDPSIPKDYRSAVKEGILRWNKAFEDIGIKNAIVVQDVPADDKDYDHASGRYNVIRMLVSPSCPFGAISLFRTDPISGEMLNASITLDGNIIRDIEQEHLRNETIQPVARQTALQVLQRSNRPETDDYYLFATPEERAFNAAAKQMDQYGWKHDECEFASGLEQYAALDWMAMASLGSTHISKEDYVKEFLSDCVSHEVGHCLGLRHNFSGSTNLTTTELAEDEETAKGISASVMDYNPPNIQSILRGKGAVFMPTIGAYDHWAIQYGYSQFDAKTPLGEKFNLSQIASKSGLPGHAYTTDSDADTWNPYSVRFDGAKDPLNYSERVLLAAQRTRDYAVKNLPKAGESYSVRTNAILSSILRSFREGRNAARFVGGVVSYRNFKGDAGEHPTLAPIDPKLERQAVHLIAQHFFAPGSFDMPTSVMTSLSTDENDTSWNAPLRDVLGGLEENLMALLMSASTTDRIAENSYKSRGGYGLDEHYGILLSSIFDEVGKNENIGPIRRDLQRFALSALMIQAGAPEGSVNEDVRMITNDSLKRLQHRFDAQLVHPEKLDGITKVHLRDSRDTIGRFLSREEVSTR